MRFKQMIMEKLISIKNCLILGIERKIGKPESEKKRSVYFVEYILF